MRRVRGESRLANEAWEALLSAHAVLIKEFAADGIWRDVSMREYDVLYTLAESQAKAAGVAEEDFGRAMVGDAVLDGFDALRWAFVDFCPSRQAKPLRALLAKTLELEAEIASMTLSACAGNTAELSASAQPSPA